MSWLASPTSFVITILTPITIHGSTGRLLFEPVEIVAYDAQWPDRFAELAAGIRRAFGPRVLAIEHVGSTAVPGLAGKNVVDIDLTVTNPADEEAYVPALSSIGYILTVREPSWHQHRCLRLQSPRANVHVFFRFGLSRNHSSSNVSRTG